MSIPGASGALVGHVALLAIISFGGVPGVLPDLRDFCVCLMGDTCSWRRMSLFSPTLPGIEVAITPETTPGTPSTMTAHIALLAFDECLASAVIGTRDLFCAANMIFTVVRGNDYRINFSNHLFGC